MPSDVFISYSHMDKITADLMCDTLEENGIKCWVAHRNMLPGSEWPGRIIQAIESSKIMVLVFSNHSNISGQVIREVERAVSKNVIIIPFKIVDVKMSLSLEYLVSASHWLNACDQPLEKKMIELVGNIKKLLYDNNSIGPKAEKIKFEKTEIKIKSPMLLNSNILIVLSLIIIGFLFFMYFYSANHVSLNDHKIKSSSSSNNIDNDAVSSLPSKNSGRDVNETSNNIGKPFQNFKIDPLFQKLFLDNPFWFEQTGAKIVKLKNGNTILISIGSAVLKNNTPNAKSEAEKIANIRALANFASSIHGVQVSRIEKLNEKNQIIIENDKEVNKSISEHLEITETKVNGLVKNMQVIGTWYSNDVSIFYLAIGKSINKDGLPVDIQLDN